MTIPENYLSTIRAMPIADVAWKTCSWLPPLLAVVWLLPGGGPHFRILETVTGEMLLSICASEGGDSRPQDNKAI